MRFDSRPLCPLEISPASKGNFRVCSPLDSSFRPLKRRLSPECRNLRGTSPANIALLVRVPLRFAKGMGLNVQLSTAVLED